MSFNESEIPMIILEFTLTPSPFTFCKMFLSLWASNWFFITINKEKITSEFNYLPHIKIAFKQNFLKLSKCKIQISPNDRRLRFIHYQNLIRVPRPLVPFDGKGVTRIRLIAREINPLTKLIRPNSVMNMN